MRFSRTRPRDHEVLTDCPTEPPHGCTPEAQPVERRIARGPSRSAEPGLGNKVAARSNSLPPVERELAREVQNVCGDSCGNCIEGRPAWTCPRDTIWLFASLRKLAPFLRL